MLLQELYMLAKDSGLIDNVHIQKRIIHFVVKLETDGSFQGLIPLYSKDRKDKERLGKALFMPRFPGENNGGKAYFLAESSLCVFGIDPDSGATIRATLLEKNNSLKPQPELLKKMEKEWVNSIKSFNYFWDEIKTAYDETKNSELLAILNFKEKYIGVSKSGFVKTELPFFDIQANRNGKLEFGVKLQSGQFEPLAKTCLTFSVNGKFAFAQETDIGKYWSTLYRKKAWTDSADDVKPKIVENTKKGFCVVSGINNVSIARSHKPKILGIPNLSSGGYIVSFAKEAPAFSSYGFEMGGNAPVSETAAAGYALGLQSLLDSENNSLRIGPSVICFWAKHIPVVANIFASKLNKPDPKSIADFLKVPFSGLDRELAKKDKFYSVTLSGNSGRVVVRNWIQTPVESSVLNLHKWFRDLEIETIWQYFEKKKTNKQDEGNTYAPLALLSLAQTSVRESKDLRAETVTELYRAALENSVPPISMLKQVLHRFKSDLVDKKRANYAWSHSRFALIKLILIRNSKEGEFMPDSILNENTTDPAYNCGRLLAVFGQLQEEAHKGDDGKPGLTGPGIVEKYYGGASTSPVSAFGILWRLHQHHLRKLRRRNEKGRITANAIEGKIAAIAAKFTSLPDNPNMAPELPRFLNLQEQGKFALGFYQQKAKDKHDIALAIAARKESEKEVV